MDGNDWMWGVGFGVSGFGVLGCRVLDVVLAGFS